MNGPIESLFNAGKWQLSVFVEVRSALLEGHPHEPVELLRRHLHEAVRRPLQPVESIRTGWVDLRVGRAWVQP